MRHPAVAGAAVYARLTTMHPLEKLTVEGPSYLPPTARSHDRMLSSPPTPSRGAVEADEESSPLLADETGSPLPAGQAPPLARTRAVNVVEHPPPRQRAHSRLAIGSHPIPSWERPARTEDALR